MTTDLEKKFFDTFEIKQIEYTQCTSIGCRYVYKNCNNCPFHNVYKVDYPQITDRILLELICIANHKDVYIDLEGTDIETMKNNLLENFIFFRRDVKKYVQELFKEVNYATKG